jgi:hypothetical protein
VPFRNTARTVTVNSAAAATGPRVRASSQLAYSSTTSIPIPAATAVGDLLVLITTGVNAPGTLVASSGWNLISVSSTQAVYSRPAVAGDAGSNLAVTSGSGQAATAALLVLAGATGVALLATGTVGNTPVSMATGTTSAPALFIGSIGGGTGTSSPTWAWGTAAQGGPTNPPAWSQLSLINGGGGSQYTAVSTANWTSPASYQAAPTGGTTLPAFLLLAS